MHTTTSQFFITFKATPHLNGKHVVFGQVEMQDPISKALLERMEQVGTNRGTPTEVVRITDCGLLPLV